MSSIDLSTMSELTTRQAATLLNVSVRTVQLWVESGALQAWKTAGGHRRISVRSIQQLLDEKEEKQTPGPRKPRATNIKNLRIPQAPFASAASKNSTRLCHD